MAKKTEGLLDRVTEQAIKEGGSGSIRFGAGTSGVDWSWGSGLGCRTKMRFDARKINLNGAKTNSKGDNE